MFVSKTGKRAPGHRVFFLDGYAGPGLYESGDEGSPVLAAQTAERLAKTRDLQLLLVEKDDTAYEQLCSHLGDDLTNWVAYPGALEESLASVLDDAKGCPLFAFIDPFGLPIPLDRLAGELMARDTITEVYLNFSLNGLRRQGGKLKDPTSTRPRYLKARETTLANVDASLGGDWWRAVWLDGLDDREEEIALEYVDRVRAAAGSGWAAWAVTAPDRWGGPPAYYLMLFTRHPDGIWAFHESLSLAMGDFYEWCHRAELQDPQERLWHEDREREWVETIKRNIVELLAPGKTVKILSAMEEIFGEVILLSREKHLRAAIKELYKEGKTFTPGTGALQNQSLLPPLEDQ